MISDEAYWFEHKGRGCNGTAVTWQGWALTAVYTAVMVGAAALLVERSVLAMAAIMAASTAAYLLIVGRKTRGGLLACCRKDAALPTSGRRR